MGKRSLLYNSPNYLFMKRIIAILLFSLIGTNLYPQKWEYTIGQPNLNENSNSVIEYYDNGYLISASFTSIYDDIHGWLVKTDINGIVLWDKVIGIDPDQVIINKTVYDSLGNMYIFGTIVQDIEPLWPLAIKLSACGELEWCRQLYFEEYEYGQFYDAIMLDNGDLLAVANMPDDDQFDMIFLFCISQDGDYLWKKSLASCANYPLFEMRLGSRIQFFDDIYIISGYVYSPHPNNPTVSSIRPMFIGIDTDFKELWVLEFALEDNMKGKALESIQINDSLFMGVGRYRYGGNHMNAWAMLYNNEGEQTGYQIIPNELLGTQVNESTFFEIEHINDNIYLATSGYFYGEDDEGAMGEIVFDTAGNVYNYAIRENTAGGNSSIIKTVDNKYAIACSYQYPDLSYDVYFYKVNDSLESDTFYPGNYTYDSLCTELPIQSGVIDLTGCSIITNMDDIPWLEDYNKQKTVVGIKAFPNPVNGTELTFQFQNTQHLQNTKLKFFNVYGELVHEEKIYQHQGESKVNINSWKPGLYIAIVYSNNVVVGQTKFVVQ